jgi:hypothetical protein
MPTSIYRGVHALGTQWAPLGVFLSVLFGLAAARAAPAAEVAPADQLRDRLQRHATFLASDTLEGREAGSSGGRAACQYIVEQLTRLKLQPAGDGARFTQEFGWNYRNVLALLPGSDPDLADEYVLIGAHYDHVGYARRGNAYGPIGYIHNGADDNASGTATVLEIAAALAGAPAAPRRSIVFAFWDAEEINLDGSEHWCRNPTVPLDRVRLAVNIDMVGRLNEDRVYVHGGRTAAGLRTMLARANAQTDLLLDFSNAHIRDSDHYPFFRKRIPYLMIDTGKHADYHRPSDDVERLNLDGLVQMNRLLLALAEAAAGSDALAPFRNESLAEARSTTDSIPAYRLPLRLGVTWEPRRPAEPLVIRTVDRGSAAERAGILPGDTLLRFGPHDVAQISPFRSCVAMSPSPVEALISRPDEPEPRTVRIELDGDALPNGYAFDADPAEPGVEFVLFVLPDSPAHAAGLEPGDRVLNAAAIDDLGTLRLTTERNGRIIERDLPPFVPH